MKKIIALMFIALLCVSCSGTGNTDAPVSAADGNNPESLAGKGGTGSLINAEDISVIPSPDEQAPEVLNEFTLWASGKTVSFTGTRMKGTEDKIFVSSLGDDGRQQIVVALNGEKGTDVFSQNVHVFDAMSLEEIPFSVSPADKAGCLTVTESEDSFTVGCEYNTFEVKKTGSGEKPSVDTSSDLWFVNLVPRLVCSFPVRQPGEGIVGYAWIEYELKDGQMEFINIFFSTENR